jgi:hypothetical protein
MEDVYKTSNLRKFGNNEVQLNYEWIHAENLVYI